MLTPRVNRVHTGIRRLSTRATYVVVVALVPATLALWDRFGLWSVLAGAAVVVAVGVASLAAGLPLVAAVNALVVWATLHQLGYA